MISMETIDWTGKYVFDENGRIDPHASHDNGVQVVLMGMKPLPRLRDETRKMFLYAKIDLQEIMRPATRNEFVTLLSKLWMHCGTQKKDPAAVTSMIADYWEDIGDYPRSLIEMACKKWRNKPDSPFMPRSSDFVETMYSEHHQLKKMLKRVRIALGETVEDDKAKGKTGMFNIAEILERANQCHTS